MNISKTVLCTQDLRKRSAEMCRSVDTALSSANTTFDYHIQFKLNDRDNSYTTHTRMVVCDKSAQDDIVVSDITTHSRKLNLNEHTVNALLTIPCTTNSRVFCQCVHQINENELPVTIEQMSQGDSTNMRTLQGSFAMMQDGYDNLVLSTELTDKQVVRFLVQLKQVTNIKPLEALSTKARQSALSCKKITDKLDTLMNSKQPLTKLVHGNFLQPLHKIYGKLKTLNDSLLEIKTVMSNCDNHSVCVVSNGLLTPSEKINEQESWELQGFSQSRVMQMSQNVHTLLRELSDDAVADAAQVLSSCLRENHDTLQTLLHERRELCERLHEPRRELSDVVNRRAQYVTLGAIDDALRHVVCVNDTPFGTYFPYERYAFELRQMKQHNCTNSEQLSQEVFDHCMHVVSQGQLLVNDVKNNDVDVPKYDIPVVETAWQAVLLRGLTHDHKFSPACGQMHEYASQNTYDLRKHDNVTALKVLRSSMSTQEYVSRKKAVLMLTALVLRDENHRIISRDVCQLALDSVLHASTETGCVFKQQQILDVLNLPAKKLMLQALGLEPGCPDISFLQDSEFVGMYNMEARNELQLLLLMHRS
jgi:hypothetical protein